MRHWGRRGEECRMTAGYSAPPATEDGDGEEGDADDGEDAYDQTDEKAEVVFFGVVEGGEGDVDYAAQDQGAHDE